MEFSQTADRPNKWGSNPLPHGDPKLANPENIRAGLWDINGQPVGNTSGCSQEALAAVETRGTALRNNLPKKVLDFYLSQLT